MPLYLKPHALMTSNAAEIDGGFFGAMSKPTNLRENRRDRRQRTLSVALRRSRTSWTS
jgi:hypothetical protein